MKTRTYLIVLLILPILSIFFIYKLVTKDISRYSDQFDPIYFFSEFRKIENKQNTSTIEKCNINDGTKRITGLKINKDGKILVLTDPKDETFIENLIVEYVGKYTDWNVAFHTNNFGGSGWFSSITLYKIIDNNEIQYKTIYTGDRGFGGIINCKLIDNKIIFKVNMDPDSFCADILKNDGTNFHAVATDKNLGIGTYEYNITTAQLKLKSLEINTAYENGYIWQHIKNKLKRKSNILTREEDFVELATFLSK